MNQNINLSIFRNEVTGVTNSWFEQKLRTGGIYNRCTHLELDSAECMEAYGVYRGNRYCKEYYNDFIECTRNHKSNARYDIMRAERYKQVIEGKRGLDDKSFYGRNVDRDSYLPGPYAPH